MRIIITENQRTQMLNKIWDKLKANGKQPTLNREVLNSLGFNTWDSEPRFALTHYLGGYDKVKEDAKNLVLGKTFNTDDYDGTGSYSFTFTVEDVWEENEEEQAIQFIVKFGNGTVDWYDEDGEEIGPTDILDAYSQADMTESWEFKSEIQDIIKMILEQEVTNKTGIDVEVELLW